MAETPQGPEGRTPGLAEQIVKLSALSGGLAHEIRNPLSTLKVNLQLLDEDWQRYETGEETSRELADVSRRSRKRVAAMLSETSRLERILEDFLRYVGKRDLRLVNCDLNVLLREMADFYRPQADAARVRLALHLADEPVAARVDVTYFKQALLNLLINAQQAMPEGGDLTLSLSRPSLGIARIDVSDTGPGVAPELHQRVFDAYFSTKKAGTGLGLATTRQIIGEHGGEVTLRSTPPHGATFSIVLPLGD